MDVSILNCREACDASVSPEADSLHTFSPYPLTGDVTSELHVTYELHVTWR